MSSNDAVARSPVSIDLTDTAQAVGAIVLAALAFLVFVRQGFRPRNLVGG